jgi:hypothetical protein
MQKSLLLYMIQITDRRTKPPAASGFQPLSVGCKKINVFNSLRISTETVGTKVSFSGSKYPLMDAMNGHGGKRHPAVTKDAAVRGPPAHITGGIPALGGPLRKKPRSAGVSPASSGFFRGRDDNESYPE